LSFDCGVVERVGASESLYRWSAGEDSRGGRENPLPFSPPERDLSAPLGGDLEALASDGAKRVA
jgi:hypothetical protein